MTLCFLCVTLIKIHNLNKLKPSCGFHFFQIIGFFLRVPSPLQNKATPGEMIRIKKCIKFAFLVLRWQNTVFACALADAIQHVLKDCKNKHSVDSAINLFAKCPHYLCFLFHNWMHCIDSLSLLSQRYVRKGIDAKRQAIFRFLFVTEGTQLNAVHA